MTQDEAIALAEKNVPWDVEVSPHDLRLTRQGYAQALMDIAKEQTEDKAVAWMAPVPKGYTVMLKKVYKKSVPLFKALSL